MKYLARRFGLSLLMLGLVALPQLAVAAPSDVKVEDLTVSPTQVKLDINPGASASGTVTVMNDGDSSFDFHTYVTPYSVSGEDYSQSFLLKPNQTDVSSWFRLSAQVYHLEAHQRMEVPYNLKVPTGIGPGGYYATLFAETQPLQQPGGGVKTKKRVGVIFYIRANGAVDQQGSVESFQVNFWQTSAPLVSTLRLSNRGNVHYTADISEKITDLFGNTKVIINTSHVILPQTIRRLQLSWDKVPSFGLFRVSGTVNMLGRTETLPSHLVLVMSEGAFVIVFAAIVIVLFMAVVWLRRRSR